MSRAFNPVTCRDMSPTVTVRPEGAPSRSTDSIEIPVISPTATRTARVRVVDGLVTFRPQGCDMDSLRVPASLLGPGAALYVDGAESNPGCMSVVPVITDEPTRRKKR